MSKNNNTMFSVKVDDNTKKIIEQLGKEVEIILATVGEKAEGYAKTQCPVDTGRLRNSITHREDGGTVYVGSNVEYAADVEFIDRAHKNGKAHFLRDAMQDNLKEYKEIIEQGVAATVEK